MTTSVLENKILNLQARLRADGGDAVEENAMPPPSSLSSPRQGSGRRPKQREFSRDVMIVARARAIDLLGAEEIRRDLDGSRDNVVAISFQLATWELRPVRGRS